MSLRWYSVVVDCHDVAAQARWWADVLDWHTIFEADDEVAIVPKHVTPESLRTTPWQQVGPGLVFVLVPEDKTVKNRLHIDLAPQLDDDQAAWSSPSSPRGQRGPTSGRTRRWSNGLFWPIPRATSSACCPPAPNELGPVRSAPATPPALADVQGGLRVVSIPMRVRFRGLTQREAVLIHGPVGWGEFAGSSPPLRRDGTGGRSQGVSQCR
jgi:hypothetical protein